MNKNETNRLVQCIENAIDWLLKAKGEYNQENQIRAELNLNLAQAEVKHAWELSRQQSVVIKQKQLTENKVSYLSKYGLKLLPVAASLIIGTVLTVIFWGNSANQANLITQQPVSVKDDKVVTTPEKDKLIVANNIPPVVAAPKTSPSITISKPDNLPEKELPKRLVAKNKNQGTNQVKKSSDLIEVAPQSSPKIISAKINTTVQSVPPVVAKTETKQTAHHEATNPSVSANLIESAGELREKLSFNEDDLTKIATYSLFNGK